jgi:hypothetical protein
MHKFTFSKISASKDIVKFLAEYGEYLECPGYEGTMIAVPQLNTNNLNIEKIKNKSRLRYASGKLYGIVIF